MPRVIWIVTSQSARTASISHSPPFSLPPPTYGIVICINSLAIRFQVTALA